MMILPGPVAWSSSCVRSSSAHSPMKLPQHIWRLYMTSSRKWRDGLIRNRIRLIPSDLSHVHSDGTSGSPLFGCCCQFTVRITEFVVLRSRLLTAVSVIGLQYYHVAKIVLAVSASPSPAVGYENLKHLRNIEVCRPFHDS